MGDALFGLLTGGASFDTSRFRKDISAFQRPSEQQQHGQLDLYLAAQAGSKREALARENSPAGAQQVCPRCDVACDVCDLTQRCHDHSMSASRACCCSSHLERVESGALPWRRAERDPLSATDDSAANGEVVSVTGSRGVQPLAGFESLAAERACHQRLLQNVARAGFQTPTTIQRHAIPCMLAQRDLYAIAPTGSGKTIAFLLPGAPCTREACAT